MKKILTLVAVLFFTIATQAQTLQSLFEKYSDDERFTYVTVGNGMMNLANVIGRHGHQDKNKDMVSKMKSIKILSLEDGNAALMKSFVQELDL